MKERLKQIRLKLGYSQQEMADILGVELNTYRGYEYKTKNLPDIFLKALAIKLDVNINRLLTGIGEMLNNTNGLIKVEFSFTKEEVLKLKKILLSVD